MREGGEIMLCSAYQLGLFACINTRGGTAEFCAAAHAHLHEHQRFIVLHKQVDLAEAATVVACNEFQAALLQISRGDIFGLRAGIYFAGDGGLLPASAACFAASFAAALAALSAASVSAVSPIPCLKKAGTGSRRNC